MRKQNYPVDLVKGSRGGWLVGWLVNQIGINLSELMMSTLPPASLKCTGNTPEIDILGRSKKSLCM